MRKSTKYIAAVLVLVAAICTAFLLAGRKESGPVARITLDGELLEEIDLAAVEEAYTLTVDGPGGFCNVILVEPGRVRVQEAGCPDQVCVNQGYISDGRLPIVCLPNKLIVQIVGGGDDLDAAAG